jgi:exopolysaccharide production protein ExoZ
MRKNEALQILRAVAALLVVNRHALEVVRFHQSVGSMNSYSLDKFGAVGVDIFFAISGFILSTVILRAEAATPRLAFDFLVRRFTRIFPIYWILSLFFLVLAATHKLFTSKWAIDSYLLLPSGYPLRAPLLLFGWTLMFEMFFYYAISFNLLFGKQGAIPRTITSILLLVGIGAIVGFQRPVLILIANPMNVEFVLGCFIALLHANFGKRPALGLALLLSGGIALGATAVLGYGHIDEAALTLNGQESWARVLSWGLPAAVVTAGVVFGSGQVRSAVGRFAVYLGDASYSIYLTSVITLFVANRFYLPAGFPAPLNAFLLICLATLVGSSSYRWLEQPLTRSLTRKYDEARRHSLSPLLHQ